MIRLQVLLFYFLFYSPIIRSQYSPAWKFTANGAIYSSPIIDDSLLYFGSNDSCLYALEKATGAKKWMCKTAGAIKSKPGIYKGSIIFNSTDGFVYSLDKANGILNWKFKTGGEKDYDMWDYYLSSPVVFSDIVYIGSGDSCVYALRAQTGKQLWKYKTNGIVHASAVIADSKVLIGSYDGYFYALHYQTGRLVWKFNTIGDTNFPKGEVPNTATRYKNAIIFGSRDYNIYALDISNGNGLWNMKERGSWIVATPLVVNDAIYFGTSDTHRFYCMDANDGNVKWTLPLNMRVYGTAETKDSSVFFGCFNGKLYDAHLVTGKPNLLFQTNESRLRYATVFKPDDHFRDDFNLYGENMQQSEKAILNLGAILSSPLIENNSIYFGDANGFFYCVSLK